MRIEKMEKNKIEGAEPSKFEAEGSFWQTAEQEAKEKQKYLKTKDFLAEKEGGQNIHVITLQDYVFSSYENKPTIEWTVLIRTGVWKGQEKVLTIYPTKAMELAKELGTRELAKWKGITLDAVVIHLATGKDKLVLKKRVELD